MVSAKKDESKTQHNVLSADIDLVEWYYEQGFSDGLPVVPNSKKIDAMLEALGAAEEISNAGCLLVWAL